MHKLAEIQESLKNAIFSNNIDLSFIKNNNITANDRFMIHRDTVLENFITNLKIIYPGVLALIGENCARGASLAYIHDLKNLIERSELEKFGDQFPDFLSEFASTKHLKYLQDYAKLELMRSKSYEAIAQPVLTIEELEPYFNEFESCQISFNSSVFFLESNYPLMEIQDIVDDVNQGEISLNKNQSFIMVCRVNYIVETVLLEEQEWRSLKSINDNKTIQFVPENQLIKLITLMISKQLITSSL